MQPINTGKKTKAGRPLYQDPKTGEMYSEKTVTIPLKTAPDGRPAEGTKWVNVPSVFEGGQIMDDERFLSQFYRENGYKDHFTGKSLDTFNDVDSAVQAAEKRSRELLD